MESMFQSYRFAGSSDHPHDEDGVRESMARGKASVRSRHISPSRMGCRMSNRDAPAMGLKEKTRKRGCEHNRKIQNQARENKQSKIYPNPAVLSHPSNTPWMSKYVDVRVNSGGLQMCFFIKCFSLSADFPRECCSVAATWERIEVGFSPEPCGLIPQLRKIMEHHGTLGLKIPENPKELSGKLDYVSMVLVFNLDRKPPAIGTI